LGSNIRGLVDSAKRTITIENLNGKTLAVDAFNMIYQFLNAIKDAKGKPFVNRFGNVTSHLIGLLYRNLTFLENGIKLVYCFDGKEKDTKLRWGTTHDKKIIGINDNIIESSKLLLENLGIPYIQALGDGENQCIFLNELNQVWGTISQDYDVLIGGGARLIRNLSNTKSRKKGDTKIDIPIEFITLEKLLFTHNITWEQLVDIVILIGNDYFAGISGIGEKTALKYIKEYSSIDNIPLYDSTKDTIYDKNNLPIIADEFYNQIVPDIRSMYLHANVNRNYRIKRQKPNLDGLKDILINQYDFSEKRVMSYITKLRELIFTKRQTTLFEF